MVTRRRFVALAALAVMLAGCDKHRSFVVEPPAPTPAPGWLQTAGPSTASIDELFGSDDLLFASGDGGLRWSSDRGATWRSTGHGRALAIAQAGGTVAASIYYGLFLRSEDGAWNVADVPWIGTVMALTTHDGALLAGIQERSSDLGGSIYSSTDEGRTWTISSTRLEFGNWVTAFLSHGSVLYAATSAGSLYRSSDGGASWHAIGTGLAGPSIEALHAIGSNLIAGTRFAGLWVSDDGGYSWTANTAGVPADARVGAFLDDGATTYAATSRGLFRSTDEGTSWQLAATCLPAGSHFSTLASVGGELVAGTWGRGVIGTADRSIWNLRGPALSAPAAVAELGSTLLAGVEGIYRSVDGGATWSLTNITTGRPLSFAAQGATWFAGTEGHGLYRSSDGGATWTPANTGLPANPWVKAIASNGTSTVLSAPGGATVRVFHSTNSGESWSPASGLPAYAFASAIVSTGSWLIAGVNASNPGPVVYRSNDGGATWQPSSSGLNVGQEVHSLASDGTRTYAGTSAGIYVSRDDGATWAPIGLHSDAIRFIAAHDTRIFAVTMAAPEDLVYSDDSGRSWTRVPNALPAVGSIGCLAAGSRRFLVGKASWAVWELPY